MMKINNKQLDANVQLKKVEYTQMEKSFIFANKDLQDKLLKADSKYFQLENIRIKLKKELNQCQEKIDLQMFNTKKLNNQIQDLKLTIQNLKNQNEKQIQKKERVIKNQQNDLVKQRKKTQLEKIKSQRQIKTIQEQKAKIYEFQTEVKTLEDSFYKKKLKSEDITNQKLADNQVEIKNYLMQLKKNGEIIEELTRELAKTTANLNGQNLKLTQTLKRQKQFYLQKLNEEKNIQNKLKKQYEDRQAQLKKRSLKEKEQNQRQKRMLKQQNQKLQEMIRDHLELDITSDSYRNIRNEYIEIENLINQKLKEFKLQKKQAIFASLKICFEYFHKQKDSFKKEMQKKTLQLQVKNVSLIKGAQLSQQKIKQAMIQMKNLEIKNNQQIEYIKQLQTNSEKKDKQLKVYYDKQKVERKRIQQIEKQKVQQTERKRKQQQLLQIQQKKRQLELKQKQQQQTKIKIKLQQDKNARKYYGDTLTIDQKLNWILQFNFINNINNYEGISKLAQFNTSRIIKIDLYDNNIGDQGWLQLVNLKLDKLQSLKVLYNNLTLLKDIHKISHLQQLLIADYNNKSLYKIFNAFCRNKLTKQSAELIVKTKWPNLKTLSVDFKYQNNYDYCQLPQCFIKFVDNKFVNFPVLTELYCGISKYLSSQSQNSLIQCSQVHTNNRIKIIKDLKK